MELSKYLKVEICIRMSVILLLISCVAGCGTNQEKEEPVAEPAAIEESSETGKMPESQTVSLTDVMYSIAERQGLEGAWIMTVEGKMNQRTPLSSYADQKAANMRLTVSLVLNMGKMEF